MPRHSEPASEDAEVNGLTCPGYYERKLADVEARLAAQRAGYRPAYWKMVRIRGWVNLFAACISLFVLAVLRGWIVLPAWFPG